jgi:hypothetical protein
VFDGVRVGFAVVGLVVVGVIGTVGGVVLLL